MSTALPQVHELGFDVAYDLLDYEPPLLRVEAPSQTWRTDSEWPQLHADKFGALSRAHLG